MKKYILLGVCAVSLTGCGLIKNHGNDYLSANMTPSLSASDLPNAQFGNSFVIPGRPYTRVAASLVPPGSMQSSIQTVALQAVNNASIPTLTIAESEQMVWPKLVTALPLAGYPISLQNQTTGIFYILDISSTKYRNQINTPMNQLHVIATSNEVTQLFVTDNQGKTIDPVVAKRILSDISHGLNGEAPSQWLKVWRNISS